MAWSEVAPGGVLRIPGANALFLEPSLILSSFYSNFSLIPSLYYCRSFFLSSSLPNTSVVPPVPAHSGVKKNKKRKRKTYSPNLKEKRAEERHLEIRNIISDAHTAFKALAEVPSLLESIEDSVLQCERVGCLESLQARKDNIGSLDFVKLGSVWQAPLYDISLSRVTGQHNASEGQTYERGELLSTFPLFNHMIQNDYNEEAIGMCGGIRFLCPKKARFLISDFARIGQLISSDEHDGYNLLLIDPPWENKSVHRRALYPTLPNRALLSLPLQKFVHPDGALIGIWVTNREKLRSFVEDELFPSWGIVNAVTWYWLKIKSNGAMISELNLTHHKPYECLFLGYVHPKKQKADFCTESLQTTSGVQLALKSPPDRQVLISIPGDHSRKPPVGLLLSAYVPGHAPIKALEIFARDLNPGWTAWGNEPLRFQPLGYFRSKL